jgi:hypothetical protein
MLTPRNDMEKVDEEE